MKLALTCLLLPVFLFVPHTGCRGGEEEGFACLTDNDCPFACRCPIGGGICLREGDDLAIPPIDDAVCGGTCDRETSCPDGTSCRCERRVRDGDDLLICNCRSPGGAGGNGGNGGDRGVFERCEESTTVYCENGYDCQGTWAVSSETFDQFYGPSLPDCLDTGSCPTTEAEECNEGGTYNAANHEACIDGQKASNCEVEDVGGLLLPVFPPECDEICVQ